MGTPSDDLPEGASPDEPVLEEPSIEEQLDIPPETAQVVEDASPKKRGAFGFLSWIRSGGD